MKNLIIFFAISLFILSACSSVKQSYSPSGKPSYEISCNNGTGSLNPCYQKSGEICKSKGYIVISEQRSAPFQSIISECKE